ncbi:hypothetical protein CAPN006_17880 [Capnocytophaga canimorsus]|uniref:Restriction endonuclease subunit S n=1 Tax=Capnocytophaga cynodegmi TaxID=28189 RepID=A0A250E8L7_9FLAO|nr:MULTISPECIES: restriction endonuclease subunit S [Capnocytophaga]ATA69191.1 restriction endonuclease subunit S [Capnocytophaga cynodegmi]GIM57395.1 hypothetical protein CAPN006_17880 [Capnocytophaga canimorsus]
MQVAKINSSSITTNSFMLKPNFHMNFGKRRIERAIKQGLEFKPLGEVVNKVFTGGIFKRVFVDDAEYGLPYISAQHMMNSNPLDVAKIISKKYTPRQDDMSLKENQILVSCAGTVGNIKLITKDLEGVIGSQDIIRIDSDNNKLLYGYLYAFLSSKTAYAYIQSFIYGSVVPRIEPNTLRKLPIPILPEEFQQRVHNLIVDSAQLRVEANKLLKEAVEVFESEIGESNVNHSFQVGKVSSSKIYGFQKRFDSQYQLGWNALEDEMKQQLQYRKLSSIASKIFVGGRGKRNYVENGVPFLSSSDMMLFNPKRTSKKISASTQGLEQMKVGLHDILISRSGTVGNTVIVGKDLEGTVISEHALRLVVNEKEISPLYVFAFLKTKFGLKTMESSSFGSVIITLNEDLIGNINLPILDKTTQELIVDKVSRYIEKYDTATELENQAIDLIEKEIDQWQQS